MEIQWTTKILQQATVGFVQVWREVATIISSNTAAFGRAGQHGQTLVLNIYLYQKPGYGFGRK